MNNTAGVSVLIWPQWLEGSVGLRDVLVAGNSIVDAHGHPLPHGGVFVGRGTSNITVIPGES